MKLFCYSCGVNHEFDLLDVERLVYGFQAELAESRVADTDDPFSAQFRGKDAYDAFRCLNDHSGMAGDCEGYGEHTMGLLENRREIDNLGGCLNCREDVTLGVELCDNCLNAEAKAKGEFPSMEGRAG